MTKEKKEDSTLYGDAMTALNDIYLKHSGKDDHYTEAIDDGNGKDVARAFLKEARLQLATSKDHRPRRKKRR